MGIRFAIVLGIFLLPLHVLANNLQFGLAELQGHTINLPVTWSNAWNYTDGSHDAIWIFVKGKRTSGIWEHVQVSTNPSDYPESSPFSIEPASDGKGVMVCPSGSGHFSTMSGAISIIFSHNLSHLEELRVFGVEMVYVPEGPYYLGDGASISSFGNQQGEPFLINSSQPIQAGALALVNPNDFFDPPQFAGTIPAEYPKGFEPFYIMKYEISQQQYADFLNTLTYAQQRSRTWSPPNSAVGTHVMVNPALPDSLHRNAIVIALSGTEGSKPAQYALDGNGNGILNELDDAHFRALNFISWSDLAAYLDWAALRPITEMEFEKACRGPLYPQAGEFAWGTPWVVNANTVLNDGTEFEGVQEVATEPEGLANHGNMVVQNNWGLRGPLRTGFAAGSGSSRQQAGATYFGVMEMSGNVWEMVIAANGDGLSFFGQAGNGQLTSDGFADVTGWCSNSTASGVIVRGGGWGSIITEVGAWRDLAVSDRYYSHMKPNMRRNTFGGRGGR